jgi:hypothetical protein
VAAGRCAGSRWGATFSGSSDGAAVADAGSPAIAPADIPSRADADEKFIQAVRRRSQMTDKVRRLEQTLSRQSAAVDQLSQVTDSNDLSQLSVQRLESLERHWQLKDRALNQTRADIARATNMASEDAAELAVLRTAWQATAAQPNLSPALVQRADELITQIDAAQAMLADPLAKLLDLGRKGNALSTQVQKGVSEVVREVVRPGPAPGDDGFAAAVAGDPRGRHAGAGGFGSAPQPGDRICLRARFRRRPRTAAAGAGRLCAAAAAGHLLAAAPRQGAGRRRPAGRACAAGAGTALGGLAAAGGGRRGLVRLSGPQPAPARGDAAGLGAGAWAAATAACSTSSGPGPT